MVILRPLLALLALTTPIRSPTTWDAPSGASTARVAGARARHLDTVKGLFTAANIAFPPRQILLRAFKREGELELWAASASTGPLTLVSTYGICYASGDLGPKRREGDNQVPEGFYTLSRYNPASAYHLSMQISYPNQSDRLLGDKAHLGGDIMIHGSCVSIGCLAMSDERIEELWLATTALRERGGTVAVHLFPTRDMAGLLREQPDSPNQTFWENLAEGLALFNQDYTLPSVSVDQAGKYVFNKH